MSMEDGLLINRAMAFAAAAHEGQKRKGTDIPYIVHPFEVAQILVKAEADTEVIAAGILHDTLEDTRIKSEDILREFGGTVTSIVRELTEDKSLVWEARKAHSIKYLRDGASMGAAMVCCADKLSNLRSIKNDMDEVGEQVWERFKRGFHQQRNYYADVIEAIVYLEDFEMYDELKDLYGEVFGEEI